MSNNVNAFFCFFCTKGQLLDLMQVNLSIVGGTCFTNAIINDTQVADVVNSPKIPHCTWVMLEARGLGRAVVTVYDVGLSPPLLTSAYVSFLVIFHFCVYQALMLIFHIPLFFILCRDSCNAVDARYAIILCDLVIYIY